MFRFYFEEDNIKEIRDMRIEALEEIEEKLEYEYIGDIYDLHNDIFNTSYYVVGTYKAKNILNELGTFDVIGDIVKYEKDHFGEVHTDLSQPEAVLNMFYYLIGEDVIHELNNNSGLSDNRISGIEDRTLLLNEIKEIKEKYNQ